MGKNIKKSIKYIIITTGIIIILPTLLFSILRFHRVQTYIAQQVAAHFSEELKSTISIGSLEYTFFNKINFKDILIKDQHNDTMIYSRRATISVQNLDLKSKKYGFGRIELVDPVISLITDTGGMMNLNWYLDKLKGPGDSTGKSAVITIREIDLNDAIFNLIDKRDTSHNRSGINFSSINLKNINGIAESFRIENDTTRFNIYNLSFNEKSGFNTKRLNTEVKLAKNNVHFDSMKLLCDSSIINLTEFDMRADSSSSFKDFINDVNLNLELEKSLINTGELSYFVPALKEFNETIWFSGRIAGTIAELRGRDINMEYGNFSSLDCDFDISGLPSIENSFIYIGISNLKVSTSDIDGINIPGKGPLVVPEILRRIETLSFDGSFTGFTTDFVAYGNLRTRYGTIRTDISLRPKEAKDFRIKGLIQASGLALGELAGNNDMFGNCSFSTNVDGIAESFKSFSGAIEGLVDSIEINNYKYRKINLNGEFSEKAWDGTIKVSDQNILLDLLGKLDFGDKLPKFDFTLDIKKANLYNLYFDKKDTTSSLSALITANFIGNNIDNIDGKINVINSNIIKYGNPLELNNFSINTFSENNKPAINLRTDFIDVDIRGYYSFSRLGTLAKSALASIMPAKFYDSKIAIGGISNNFNFSILFKNTDKLNDFFKTGIYIASKSSISGEIAGDSLVNIRGNSKEFVLKNNVFHDVAFTAHYEVPNISLNVITSSLTLIDNSILKDFNVNLLTQPDTFNITAGWDNKETVKNMGNFIASGKFYNNPVAGGKPLLKINVDSSEIYINNNLWKINRSDIIIDSTAIDINKVNIRSKDRFYLVDGKISENQRDTLTLQFNGIDISPLNYILFQKTDNPDQVSLSLHGILSGKLSLTNIYHNPLLEADARILNFSMLESDFGDLSIVSAWNNEKKVAEIKAFNSIEGKHSLDIEGFYDPLRKNLDLRANADKLSINPLNPLLKSFASGISGKTSGKVRLSGETNKLILKGSLWVENGGLKIDYLQTRFNMSDSVRFDKNGIIFRNVNLTDEKGSRATLNGSINHTYFKNYIPDLLISFNDCMVLNTKAKDNDYFYGTAYSSGVTTLRSNNSILSFGISAQTGKGTKFYIPLNTSETVSNYSFINFISHDTIRNDQQKKTVQTQTSLMDLNFDLDLTPDAEVQLIFDPTVGDAMKAHGSGKLNIRLDPKGNYTMSGDYLIDDGDYLFTLGNILNKSFKVVNDSKITFNGDLDNAEIDLKAVYSLKTSLYELVQDENYRERIPVECQINLTGKLFNPVVKFEITLPQADETAKTIVKNATTTEEELSRQFVYLLVMNSFYADPAIASTTPSTATTGTSAMAVTTTEMISNQLSNWLSQISNDFDLGFLYRPGSEINNQEVEFALKTQILNDRVTINGNFDVRGTQSENYNQISGDFDVETKITEKIRFKVFNRTNNPYEGKGVGYTQGISLVFKQEFDKMSDFFKKKDKSEIKKEDEVVVAGDNQVR